MSPSRGAPVAAKLRDKFGREVSVGDEIEIGPGSRRRWVKIESIGPDQKNGYRGPFAWAEGGGWLPGYTRTRAKTGERRPPHVGTARGAVLAALERAEADGDEATTARGLATRTGLTTADVSAALACLKRCGRVATVAGTRRWFAIAPPNAFADAAAGRDAGESEGAA